MLNVVPPLKQALHAFETEWRTAVAPLDSEPFEGDMPLATGALANLPSAEAPQTKPSIICVPDEIKSGR